MSRTTHVMLIKWIIVISSACCLISACNPYYFRENYREANDFLRDTENMQEKLYLKAHLEDGKVYILRDKWTLDTTQNILKGEGSLYDANRRIMRTGPVNVPIDSIVIFETNKSLDEAERNTAGGLAILGGLDVLFGLICITAPKSCFGSCPTFYINEEDNFHFADAEGFSKAISPSLEYADIDALSHIATENFSITMKNEALETHCVNQVSLLAVAQRDNERVYQSAEDTFYRCDFEFMTGQALAEEGDITDLLIEADRNERFSLADEQNMLSKEEIYLTFETPSDPENLGLLISFRQSLMTTYLIYSGLDYMGPYVSDIFAKMESNDNIRKQLRNGIKEELGGIEIHVWNEESERWEVQGSFYETGPIAFNKQILPLQNEYYGKVLKVKIVLNRGLWRLDQVALTQIHEEIEPIILTPYEVLNKGKKDPDALNRLKDQEAHLISMPGSAYQFNFTMPDKEQKYELFLQSKGYYLEWMRESWLKESNMRKLHQLVKHPRRYLKTEAKAYKEYEKYMEEVFWNSRIDTRSFSYYDN